MSISSTELQFAYAKKTPFTFPALQIQAGEPTLVLGQSGCGKTTFLHLLTGLLQPQKGNILIDNQDITLLKGSDADRFRGQNIGIVLQESHFVQSLTVHENLLLAQQLGGKKTDKKTDRTRIKFLLEALNIGQKTYEMPKNLSIGEQQRVSIARALLNQPKVLFADEPTSALDDANAAQVITLLENLCRNEGSALLIVTHDNRLKTRFAKTLHL
jgi:ABC-type lipoprotein export system ATPase subunit